jgi:hypothetical protein
MAPLRPNKTDLKLRNSLLLKLFTGPVITIGAQALPLVHHPDSSAAHNLTKPSKRKASHREAFQGNRAIGQQTSGVKTHFTDDSQNWAWGYFCQWCTF